MKITSIKTWAVKGRKYPPLAMLFVQVETDKGITGLGECRGFPGITSDIREMERVILGEDPFNVEKLYELMFRQRQGHSSAAISGIEIALWDIMGKSLGVPVYKLLGGRCYDKLRVYCDGFFRGAEYAPKEYASKAKEAVKNGFTALKMDVDSPFRKTIGLNRVLMPTEIQLTVDVVGAVRKAIGPNIDLAIDAHGAFNIATATILGEKLAPLNLFWYEDPVSQENIAALSKLGQNIKIPICTGERLRSRFEYRELFEKQAAQIIMPDVGVTGGIMETKKIAAIADTYFISVAPHNVLGPVATMANIHMCASMTNFYMLEYQLDDVPYRDDLVDNPPQLERGFLKVPEEPGLGLSLNMKTVKKYLVS